MKMKLLITARHPHYKKETRQPDTLGNAQIAALIRYLKTVIGEDASVLILTSPDICARKCAEAIKDAFGADAEFEEHKILWSEKSDQNHDNWGVLRLVRSRQDEAEVIILVTHYHYTVEFPTWFSNVALKTNLRPDPAEIKHGVAWVIDCVNKTLTHGP